MSECNHFFIEDRDGAVSGLTYMTVVCTECGLTSTPGLVGVELSRAISDGRYMDPDHPDFPAMQAEARLAVERETLRAADRWRASGSCTPITEPPSEPVPVPPIPTEGVCEQLPRPSLWRRFLSFVGLGRTK